MGYFSCTQAYKKCTFVSAQTLNAKKKKQCSFGSFEIETSTSKRCTSIHLTSCVRHTVYQPNAFLSSTYRSIETGAKISNDALESHRDADAYYGLD